MPRDKKGKGRRGSSRFAAQSADEIEERNRRLEAFDQKRRDHRKAEGCSDDEDSGSDAEVADTSREDALAQMKMASMSVGGSAPKRRGLEGIIEVEVSTPSAVATGVFFSPTACASRTSCVLIAFSYNPRIPMLKVTAR